MDYARHYERLIDRARPRCLLIGNKLTHETHHIIPRCMDGGEDRENLVRLTLEEHCIAHLLLAKMHPGNVWLELAAAMMSRGARHLKLPKNKRYAKCRRAVARTGPGRTYYFRKSCRAKPKRYSRADVERLGAALREPAAESRVKAK